MRVVRDLIGGSRPPTIDIHYNGDVDIDSTTKRYKGSLCKFMDFTGDVDHGTNFVTWAGDATASENIAGVLEEEQPVTGNYLPDDASYAMHEDYILWRHWVSVAEEMDKKIIALEHIVQQGLFIRNFG